MTIWDILADNQRVILWSDAEAGLLYSWNYSCTLQCWLMCHPGPGERDNGWEEIDVRTLPDKPKNARQELQRWHKERMSEASELPEPTDFERVMCEANAIARERCGKV